MPLFQIGYRKYEGRRTSHALRWWPITSSGLTIAWRSKMLRWLVSVSFLPFLYFGWVFFLIGRATDPNADRGSDAYRLVGELVGPDLLDQLQNNPEVIRSAVWSIVFALFGTHAQLIVGALVAAIVGPSLIATDLRSRSFLIYFARPVSRLDYVLGKAGVLMALLGAVSLLPSLLLYSLSILFSPSLDTLIQTAPVVLEVFLASLGAVVPSTLIVLLISSLTRQPRFATAGWIVLCTFGPLAHEILLQSRELKDNGWTFLMSLPHSIRALQLGIYDVDGHAASLGLNQELGPLLEGLRSDNSPVRAAIWLTFVSIACVLLLLRRVDAPTRI